MLLFDVISAGHLCLDMTPKFRTDAGDLKGIFTAGKLTNVGELLFATGGASANVGAALVKLGMKTAVIGKTGFDEIGDIICRELRDAGVPPDHIIREGNVNSSYTIVIAIPGSDRVFLNYPGANEVFSVSDIDFRLMEYAKVFHFGYPPLLKQFYLNNGKELLNLMKSAKEKGITTSLDMSLPDPNTDSGKADWEGILGRLLQYVDIFVPSAEELIYMLDHEHYLKLKEQNECIINAIDADYLSWMSGRLMDMGCKINLIKCGEYGLYLHTSGRSRLAGMGRAKPESLDEWSDRELFSPAYKPEKILSAAGAGDCCIAGFLAAFLKGFAPETAMNIACGAGALSVTSYGTTGGMITMEQLTGKIDMGWEKSESPYLTDEWMKNHETGAFYKSR